MDNFVSIHLEGGMGMFGDMFEEARTIAEAFNCGVSFDFNGVRVKLTKNSTFGYTFDKVTLAVQNNQKIVYGE